MAETTNDDVKTLSFEAALAQLNWQSGDYGWLTGKLMDAAARTCGNRIVSLLEGGYDLKGLAGGVSHHVAMLMDGATGRLDE